MPKTNTLSHPAYNSLRNDISAFIGQARLKAQKTLVHILVTAYWNVGKRIAREKLTAKAGYRTSILRNLAADLQIDQRTLQNCLRFHQLYPKPPTTRLAWAHFRELLRLRDPAERAFYENLAAKSSWTVRQLNAAIRDDLYQPTETAPLKPSPEPKKLRRPLHDPYLFMAEVVHVVDGDTLLLRIDLGFETQRLQRIRLACLDAPPLHTPIGRRAHDFVLDRLANAHAVALKTD